MQVSTRVHLKKQLTRKSDQKENTSQLLLAKVLKIVSCVSLGDKRFRSLLSVPDTLNSGYPNSV